MAFRGNIRLRSHRDQCEYSENEIKEYLRCRADFEYWAENYAKIATLDEGVILIKLRDYQKRMIRTIRDLPKMGKRGMVVLAPRQCGKTTGIYLYIVWLCIFYEYKQVAIIANKGANARKIIRDIKQTYEFLPLWMQPGVKEGGWNKSAIELENGSRIVSGSTTSDSIRGQTFHCLAGYTNILIRVKNNIYKVSLEDFYKQDRSKFIKIDKLSNSIWKNDYLPTGNDIISEDDLNCDMEILTGDGWRTFDAVVYNGERDIYRLTLENGLYIYATNNHEIMTSNGWVRLDTLDSNDYIKSFNGWSKVKSIEYLKQYSVYDVINVDKTMAFYANGIYVHNCVYIDEYAFIPKHAADDFMKSVLPTILSGKSAQLFATSTPKGMNQFWRMWRKAETGKSMLVPMRIDYTEVPRYTSPEFKKMIIETEGLTTWRQEFECRFLGSSKTLINPDILSDIALKVTEPIITHFNDKLKIWEKPDSKSLYIISVDSSKGVGGDYSVVQVLKVKNKKNVTQVAVFSDNLTPITELAQICVSIAKYYNNSEIIIENNDIGGVLCERIVEKFGYDRLVSYEKEYFGVRSNKKNKTVANLILREYVESGWITINDEDTVKEFSFYEEVSGNVFRAIEGEHDDRVTSLIWGLYWVANNLDLNDDMENINIKFRIIDKDNNNYTNLSGMDDNDADWLGSSNSPNNSIFQDKNDDSFYGFDMDNDGLFDFLNNKNSHSTNLTNLTNTMDDSEMFF